MFSCLCAYTYSADNALLTYTTHKAKEDFFQSTYLSLMLNFFLLVYPETVTSVLISFTMWTSRMKSEVVTVPEELSVGYTTLILNHPLFIL